MKICISILYCDLNGFWFLRGKLQKSAKKRQRENLALKSQHRLSFLHAKSLLSRAFDPFDFPPFYARSVMRKNSLVFHRNASFPRGYWCFFPRRGYDMVNQNFKAGDNTCIHACFFLVCLLSGFVSLFKSSFLKWIQIFILRVSELQSLRMLFNY